MIESKLDVRTGDGVMDVYIHVSAKANPSPVVILYTDAAGVRASMHDIAARLSESGYCVVLPNIFYRAGNFAPIDPKVLFNSVAERERVMSIVQTADAASVMRDTEALLDALDDTFGAHADRVGCFGYGIGGRFAFVAASSHSTRVAAAASVHGGNLATWEPVSPHLQAGKIRSALYFGVADGDRSCKVESQARLKAALDEAKVPYQLEVFAGAPHGFAVADNPTYDAIAAARVWERLLALFGAAFPRTRPS